MKLESLQTHGTLNFFFCISASKVMWIMPENFLELENLAFLNSTDAHVI
jgi:hypothetical protein